jgi:hypothetical protein
MRIATDGYIDLTDSRYIRTPGAHVESAEPVPAEEALAFLLSHSFPGHRRITRFLNIDERRRIRLALWADSVEARMALVDRVWRAITAPVTASKRSGEPELIQVVRYRNKTYPLYLHGNRTRVIHGSIDESDIAHAAVMDFDPTTV